jgi:DNA-binding transcriptional LysR family regulator
VTQSAVSHLLDKLRGIVGDPLFVKSGRGIVATARAEALALQARPLLDDLRALRHGEASSRPRCSGTVTIAANDLQRDLLLPPLLRRLRSARRGWRCASMPSGVPSAEMLRDESCQLVITPAPARCRRLVQRKLCSRTATGVLRRRARPPPGGLAQYLQAEHLVVHHELRGRLDIDRFIEERGLRRRVAVTVAGFSGVAPFLRGSRHLATLPGLLRASLLRGFATAAPPLPTPPMPMFMVWHQRHQADAMHRWLREELLAIVAPALAAAEVAPARRA